MALGLCDGGHYHCRVRFALTRDGINSKSRPKFLYDFRVYPQPNSTVQGGSSNSQSGAFSEPGGSRIKTVLEVALKFSSLAALLNIHWGS